MESFREACKTRGPLSLEVENLENLGKIRQVIDRPYVLIGSDPRSDLRLDHPEISRRHAYLQMIEGRCFCTDLDSRSGIHVEGEAPGDHWTKPDQWIRIGPFRVRIRSKDQDPHADLPIHLNPLTDQHTCQSLLAPATLLVERGKPLTISITRTLTLIGRSPRCRIRLTSSNASRFLASLLRTSDGLWVVDLHSSNRLEVNGAIRDDARLEEGDELRVGPFAARVGPIGMSRLTTRLPSAELASFRSTTSDGVDLGLVLDHVAGIQQQSSEQFSQVVLMITQLFGSFHREMIDLVREELEQIRQLSIQASLLQERSRESRMVAWENHPGQAKPLGSAPEISKEDRDIPDEPASAELEMTRDPAEVHAIVSERLAAFELERRGRWNKISKILLKSQS